MVLARLCRCSHVVMATKIAAHEPTKQIFSAMSKSVLKIAAFHLEFVLNPLKQFLIDDWWIEPRNCKRLSVGSAFFSDLLKCKAGETNCAKLASRETRIN